MTNALPDAPPMPPHVASELQRVRTQIASKRAEWQAVPGAVAHIPVERYTDPRIRDAEVEHLFRTLPLVVGHASELAPGQALANDDVGVPILLTRDADGRFRAFLNVCRHRGMRLVEATGRAEPKSSLVCPYHGWTYRLDGALRQRLHADAFDACADGSTDALVALPCEERHGLLWVAPTPGAPIDVASHLQGLDAELPFFGVGGLRHFRTVRSEHPANWKLIVDAFLEAYHIRVLHKDTISPFFADGITATDRFGPHVQSLVARRAAEAWASGTDTAPVDAASLCALVTPSHVVFPNAITIFHPDYLSLVSLYPVEAGVLRWTHRMLIPADKATPEWVPHWEKTFRLIEQGVFQAEDIRCAVGIQKGLASGANRVLTAGRAEAPIGWFHDSVAAAIDLAGGAR